MTKRSRNFESLNAQREDSTTIHIEEEMACIPIITSVVALASFQMLNSHM